MNILRPDSHITGDLAEDLVQVEFTRRRWVVNKLIPDYGYDFMVRRFEDEDLLAFIQVKGRGLITWREADGTFGHRIETKYLKYWDEVVHPTYLCIAELREETVFAVNVVPLINGLKEKFGQKWDGGRSRTVRIPAGAVLNTDRFSQILVELTEYWAKVREVSKTLQEAFGARLVMATNPVKQMRSIESLAGGLMGALVWGEEEGEEYVDIPTIDKVLGLLEGGDRIGRGLIIDFADHSLKGVVPSKAEEWKVKEVAETGLPVGPNLLNWSVRRMVRGNAPIDAIKQGALDLGHRLSSLGVL